MLKPLHAKYLPHAGKNSTTVVIIKNFETEKVTKKGHAHQWRLCRGIYGVFNFWDRYFPSMCNRSTY
jgi:hypothetical protein